MASIFGRYRNSSGSSSAGIGAYMRDVFIGGVLPATPETKVIVVAASMEDAKAAEAEGGSGYDKNAALPMSASRLQRSQSSPEESSVQRAADGFSIPFKPPPPPPSKSSKSSKSSSSSSSSSCIVLCPPGLLALPMRLVSYSLLL